MLQAPLRAPVRGPALIRLLARLTHADVPPPSAPLPDRLSQWLDWTQAIALSTALDGRPADASGAPAFDTAEEEECARLRASLAESALTAFAAAPEHGDRNPVDFAVFRQHYLTHQRRMQAATGRLRGRLRDMLAQCSPAMARLADVDAVMEQALSPREHALLAAVPALLGEHFERLRQSQDNASADASVDTGTPGAAHEAWLDTFRKDLQGVLLAELELRFQPIEGLLAALRTCQREPHA